MNSKRNVCIAGKNGIAVKAMRYVYASFKDEVELYILPNASDLGESSWQPSLRREAGLLSLSIVELEDCYSMKDLLFISLEFDQLIKPERFSSAALYNIHFSILPKYKGMYTSAWPILNGELFSGVTLHEIDRGVDTGAIVDQVEFSISDMSCRDLYFAYMENAYELFTWKFGSLLSGDVCANEQSASDATYYSKASIKFDDLSLDFRATAFQIQKQFRAYSFRQFQLPKFDDREICDVQILESRNVKRPGTVIFRDEARVVVSTIDYDVQLKFDFLGELLELCKNGDEASLKQTIDLVLNVNELGREGWSPLMVATYHNNVGAVNLLIKYGADINAVNCNGTTVLMYAKDGVELAKDPAVLHRLLDLGCDPNVQDARGKTVIDYCLENNESFSLEIIRNHIV